MKLIKISDNHTIIVNDDPFNEDNQYYDTKQESIRNGSNNHITGGYKKKIIASSKKLEGVDILDISDINDLIVDDKRYNEYELRQWTIG